MQQRLDFLKSTAQSPRQLPARWITFIVLACISLLTLISFYMATYQIRAYFAVKQVHVKSQAVMHTFQAIAKEHPLLASNIPLLTQIENLKKQLEATKNEFAAITHSKLRYGFSNYLGTLAKIAPKGLWLNKISINQETKAASLSGYMIEPVNVSLLLQALQASPTFAETTFNVFYIKDIPEKSYVEFNITNST